MRKFVKFLLADHPNILSMQEAATKWVEDNGVEVVSYQYIESVSGMSGQQVLMITYLAEEPINAYGF